MSVKTDRARIAASANARICVDACVSVHTEVVCSACMAVANKDMLFFVCLSSHFRPKIACCVCCGIGGACAGIGTVFNCFGSA